jgi:hypothetical protein
MEQDEKIRLNNVSYQNDAGTDNEVSVMDDIGIGMVKQQLGALLIEEEVFVEAIDVSKSNYDNYNNQWVIDKRLFELQLEHFGLQEQHYTHNLHLVPEYWDLEKEKFMYKVRQETFSAEKRLKQYEEELANAINRLAIIREEIPKKVAKLEEAGVVIDFDEIKREYR